MSKPHVKQKGYQRRSAEAIAGSNPVLTTNLNKTKTMEQKFIITDRDYPINDLLRDEWRVVSITSQRVATGGTSTVTGGFAVLLERPKQ